MEFFTRSLDDLTTADLQKLLDSGAQENVRLEFKREVPPKAETLKKLSAMANTYGGYLVIGAEEDGSGNLRDIPGVEQQRSLKQTLIQWGQSGIYPPIVPQVVGPIPAPANAAREVYVLYVSESLEAPHFLEGRKGAYIRTDEFSQRFEPHLANYEEIRHLANRRELALQRRSTLFNRAEHRYSSWIEQDYYASSNTQGPPGTLLYLAVVPTFPVVPIADQAAIAAFLRNERVPWRSGGFPRGKEVVTQHESVVDLNVSDGFSLLEVSTWGQVFYASEVERLDQDKHFVHLYSFLGHVQVYLLHAARYFRHFAFDGILSIRTKVAGLRGVQFFAHHSIPAYQKVVSRFDNELDISIDIPATELINDPEGAAKKLYRLIFFAVNWPDATADDAALDGLVAMGNEYNMVHR